MREKYVIFRDNAKNNLSIREYAIISRNPKNAPPSVSGGADFEFLCEESYNAKVIVNLIPKGLSALITTLRTENIFPVKSIALKIAESVIALYDTTEDGSVELYFDDLDLLVS